MRHSDQINEIAAALAKAQGAMSHAVKDRTNPHLSNKYATLAACIDAVRGPLSAQGIALVQSGTLRDDGAVHVTTMLVHASGQWFAADTLISAGGAKGVTNAQSIGSAITYGKRYGLMAMVGISSEDDDDDGNNASRTPARSEPAPARGQTTRTQPTGQADDTAKRRKAAAEWLRTRKLLEDAVELFGPADEWTAGQMDEMKDTATWTQRLADLRSHG